MPIADRDVRANVVFAAVDIILDDVGEERKKERLMMEIEDHAGLGGARVNPTSTWHLEDLNFIDSQVLLHLPH